MLTQDRACRPVPDAKTRKQAEALRRERRGREDGKVVIHSLRRTFTTTLLRLNVNVKVVGLTDVDLAGGLALEDAIDGGPGIRRGV